MRTRLPAVAAIAFVAMVALSAQNAPRDVDLIVTGGTVVTVDAAGRVIENGAVAIDGADIAAVDTAAAIAKQFRGRETIDASGQIVLPGLINTHTHGAWLDGGRELLADVCGPADLDQLWDCERMEHAERRGRRHTHQRRSWRSVGECALFQLGWWRALVHQPALRRRLRSPHSPPCRRGSPAEANGDFDCGWYVAEVKVGAGDRDRTGDIELGKLAFYR